LITGPELSAQRSATRLDRRYERQVPTAPTAYRMGASGMNSVIGPRRSGM
jgi:hypothetical protein